MSRIETILAGFLLAGGAASGQALVDWEIVGSPGFSAGEVMCCQIAVDAQGVVHVAYQDLALGQNPASVMRFSGGVWGYLGAQGGASIAQAWYDRLAFDPSGALLVASRDYGVGGDFNVRRFAPGATSWANQGSFGPSAGEAHYVDLAVGANGEAFVVYADRTTSPPDRATVMRWSGTTWNFRGAPGFSAGAAEYTSIALDPSGQPYVAYSDTTQGGRASVMRWSEPSGAWEAVGAPGFTAAQATNLRLSFDRAGAPWIAYHQYHVQIVAMRFDGAEWAQVGGSASGSDRPAIETESWRQWLSLAFDSQNAPHVLYQRWDDQDKAAVRRFDGAQWAPVGSLGFSPPGADYASMAIGPDDVPFVMFRDSSAGLRATVMRYAPSPHVYCDASPSSLGCVAGISASGLPGASAGGPFLVNAGPVISRKNGLLLFSSRPERIPFQSGFLCLASPFHRTGLQNSGGDPSGTDCTGAYSTDFNAILQGGAFPWLVAGAQVFAQYWHRDPGNPYGSTLTGAIRFEIGL